MTMEHDTQPFRAAVGVPANLGRLPRITLVVPVYNEEASIAAFLTRTDKVTATLTAVAQFDILFVNDGSRDATERVIRAQAAGRRDVSLVNLSRNFGKEAALVAGLSHASGDAVIPMDVDLQDPPEVIGEMIPLWLAGARVVNARRAARTGDSPMKRVSARAFYWLFNTFSDYPIPADVGDFRLMDREVVDAIQRLEERSRCNKALFSWVGFETAEITYDRPPRHTGETQWSYLRLFRLALDAIFSSSTLPLRIWTYVGMVMAVISFLYSMVLVVRTVMFGIDVPGYASTVILILVFGGVNMFALGIIGEYVGRIYTEVRQRPLYIVRSHYPAPELEE